MGHQFYTTDQPNTVPLYRAFRAPVVLSVLVLMFATASAKADCGPPSRAFKTVALLPVVAQSPEEGFGQDQDQDRDRDHDHNGSILGLWHAKYVNTDGTGFESFKFWHPDGTEWESSNVSPLEGNVCVGVWKETKTGTIRLHHLAWTFANGILTGTLTIDEINTVARDSRTYSGTHTVTFFNTDGNLLKEVKGTHTAKRITVNSTGAP